MPDRLLIEPPGSVTAAVLNGEAVLLGENDRGDRELLGGRPEPGSRPSMCSWGFGSIH